MVKKPDIAIIGMNSSTEHGKKVKYIVSSIVKVKNNFILKIDMFPRRLKTWSENCKIEMVELVKMLISHDGD